ncbi:MAG: methyltransferase domain-containing protein [Leptospirales bacterium]|nr:methyltransferase domain-containing protein [Leptospirales bacterium]
MIVDQETKDLRAWLSDYYGRQISKTKDLVTNACCDVKTMQENAAVAELIPAIAKDRYFGCGSPIPNDRAALQGLTALDLGCGTGVDAMILRYYLGPTGRMIGIDMTDAQLETANAARREFMQRVGFSADSLEFRKDFIETADSIPDESVDLVVSNCVINLSPRKDLVFQTIRRILKPGGEFFISDIVADRRIDLSDDPVLVAECLGLAPYINDVRDWMDNSGFYDTRIYSQRLLPENDRITSRGEAARFISLTWRGFKLDELDRRCEDYGQAATYKGSLVDSPAFFRLDEGHIFESGRPALVCRNTARMLAETRLARHVDVTAPIKHFGLFQNCSAATASGGAIVSACC